MKWVLEGNGILLPSPWKDDVWWMLLHKGWDHAQNCHGRFETSLKIHTNMLVRVWTSSRMRTVRQKSFNCQLNLHANWWPWESSNIVMVWMAQWLLVHGYWLLLMWNSFRFRKSKLTFQEKKSKDVFFFLIVLGEG